MRKGLWQRAFSMCVAFLCITAMSGAANVAANQLGDASGPGSESDWSALGAAFISPDEPPAPVLEGETWVLPASGTEVVVAEGVTSEDPAESGFEDQVVLMIPGGLGAVAVIQGSGQPLIIMETYVERFAESMDYVEAVDIQEDRSLAAGLYIVESKGASMWMYITVDAVTSPGNFIIQVAVTALGGIDEAIVLLRENVYVDGIPMFAGVDEQSLMDLLDDHGGN